MKIYIDLLFLALVVIFVVDLSGFTASWRALLARFLKVRDLRPLPPFDCSLCMVFWVGLIYSLAVGAFSLSVLAYVCALAFFSLPIGQIVTKFYELILKLLYGRRNR